MMKKQQENNKELVLEVAATEGRRLVYRKDIGNGTMLYLEESDLEDFSRPITENGDLNVFFTKRAFWRAFVEFTTSEGLLRKRVWHQKNHEWLGLKPVFVHDDIRHLVQGALAEAISELDQASPDMVNGIRMWLKKLAEPTTALNVSLTSSRYRHAV